jgi:dipeptidyl aminopeptidase/acylaminoacyl peptidase
LYTNVRGSTGYGDEFAHAAHSNWAEGPAQDQLLVIDHAIKLGYADANKLGIAGNSYGGYLSAWLASTTSRFQAAVIENPVTDLVSMYGTSDIGATFFPVQFGGAPHEQFETYYQQSPIMHAHKCTTPCLFVIGEDDRRCPPAQAWAMHRALCVRGTISEVLVLPHSPHEGSTYGPPSGRLAHDNALVEWMTRWLK